MTMPRLAAFRRHWERFPPVFVSAAAFTGVKLSAPASSAPAPAAAGGVPELPDDAAAWAASLPVMKIKRVRGEKAIQ